MNAELVPLWEVRQHPENPNLFIGHGRTRLGQHVTLKSQSRHLIEAQLVRMQVPDEGEDLFLAAWKRGVKFMPRLFHCTTESIDDATSKDQLRPNWEAVEAFLKGRPEPWQQMLVMALCSFFNDEWMHAWAKRLRLPHSSPGEIAIRLDTEHREVIADLIVNYRGW